MVWPEASKGQDIAKADQHALSLPAEPPAFRWMEGTPTHSSMVTIARGVKNFTRKP